MFAGLVLALSALLPLPTPQPQEVLRADTYVGSVDGYAAFATDANTLRLIPLGQLTLGPSGEITVETPPQELILTWVSTRGTEQVRTDCSKVSAPECVRIHNVTVTLMQAANPPLKTETEK